MNDPRPLAEPSVLNQVDTFTADQKKFLAHLVEDLDKSSCTARLLEIIENVLYTVDPDWENSMLGDIPDAKADLHVCLAALSYQKIKLMTQSGES